LRAGEADTEDCLQEALVAVTRALPDFRGESTVLRFAMRITVRCAIAERDRRRKGRTQEELTAQLEGPLIALPPPPDEGALQTERTSVIRALLAGLPALQAETFTRRVLLGHSIQEVARAMGVPQNTVRSRVRLAREALRARIADDLSLSDLLAAPDRPRL
jgi:RNA polymerase sigma-70 factor (ECF subfamily)